LAVFGPWFSEVTRRRSALLTRARQSSFRAGKIAVAIAKSVTGGRGGCRAERFFYFWSRMEQQSARAVVMVRPNRFFSNPETALDNAFQQRADSSEDALTEAARAEFDRAAEALTREGVTVHVFDDTPSPIKPDAVFPNNWFTTHRDGRVALFPMFTPSRRAERRRDLIEKLREHYRISEIVDYSYFEERGLFLEGTGSLVLDRIHRMAYVSLSRRSDREPLEKFCADFRYEPVTFESFGGDARPIYHTNVMMCLGTAFAIIGLELIRDAKQRAMVRDRLSATGKRIVELSLDQIENFAGNALELRGSGQNLLVLSERAATHLTDEQLATLQQFAKVVRLSLPTIELAGGSARCMMATIHLPAR
jgi:hypothetical protein